MTDSGHRRSLRIGLIATAVIGVPIAGVAGLFSSLYFSHECWRRGDGLACGDIESYLLEIPLLLVVIGLVVGGVLGVRAVRAGRSPGAGIVTAVTTALTGLLVVGIIPSAVLPSEQQYQAEQQAERDQQQASARADALAGPDLEAEQARYGELHARLNAELGAVIPGARWPMLTAASGLRCTVAGPDAQSIDDSAETHLAGPDGVLTETDWMTADAVLRRVAGTFGFTGRPLLLSPGATSVRFELRGPFGEELRMSAAANGRQAVATFRTARCLLPAAAEPGS